MSVLLQQIKDDMKEAMRAQQKERLSSIRLILAAVKQKEVDERISLDDAQVLAILDKMVKQRRDSINQYQNAQRQDLVDAETRELAVIQSYLPAQLAADEIDRLISQAIDEIQPKTPQDMGKVMAYLKPLLQGKADIGSVSGLVKQRLN